MLNFLIIIYLFFVLFSLGVMAVLLYHFRKFKLPFDPIAKKAINFYVIFNFVLIIIISILLILIIR